MAMRDEDIRAQLLKGTAAPVVGQPEQQAVIIEQPDGKKFIYPAVALAVISDQVLGNIARTTAALIFAELEARGVIAPAVAPEAAPPPEAPEGAAPEPEAS